MAILDREDVLKGQVKTGRPEWCVSVEVIVRWETGEE